MPRGGKRPGAGAPKGNLNALKHGGRSKQFKQLGEIVAASPKARKLLLRYANRARSQQRRADELAAQVIEQVLKRGLVRGRERLILLPELLHQERTIRQTSRKPGAPKRSRSRSPKNIRSDNQSPNTNDNGQSENPEGNQHD